MRMHTHTARAHEGIQRIMLGLPASRGGLTARKPLRRGASALAGMLPAPF